LFTSGQFYQVAGGGR